MKIRSVGAELFYVDRQTDRPTDITKLIFALRNLATRLKLWWFYVNTPLLTY